MTIITDTRVSRRLLDLASEVTVQPGGLSAVTAGETYDEESPAALARTLGAVLYQTMHTGREKPLDFAIRSFRDPVYEMGLLAAAAPLSRRIAVSVQQRHEDSAIVELDGIRVRVPVADLQSDADERCFVTIDSSRPGLSPGFLYNFGSSSTKLSGPLLRIYAHVADPQRSAGLWRTTIDLLQGLSVGWHAKILSTRVLYPRYDALVIYLQRDGWRHAHTIADTLQSTGTLGFGVSPFTRSLTDSVSCAFEPADRRPTHQGASFGQHRANVLAQALVDYAVTANADPADVAESIYTAFLDADIDPSEPARNLSSPATRALGLD